MRWLMVSLCAVAVLGCRQPARPQTEPQEAAVPGMAPLRVDSSGFHLELASVYERHQEPAQAIDHLSKAIASTELPAQRALAYAALARVKRAAGDRDGAIDALERARAEAEKQAAPSAGGSPIAGPTPVPGGEEHAVQLARLYAEKGEVERALQLCRSGLSAAPAPWHREQLLQLEVELLRKSGGLAGRIAEAESGLDEKVPDEARLRFLAVALAGGEAPAPAPAPWADASGRGAPPVESGKLLRTYRRLLELHPEDPQLRLTLRSLLEEAGRIDEAIDLARADTSTSAMACVVPALNGSAPVRRAAEIVRLRLRGGQRSEALAETIEIAALAKQEGLTASLVAADLFLEQGTVPRAEEALRRAAADARTRDERRQVAFARRDLLERSGRSADAAKLLGGWARSDDPCLRAAARQAAQSQAATALAPPPPPPWPSP